MAQQDSAGESHALSAELRDAVLAEWTDDEASEDAEKAASEETAENTADDEADADEGEADEAGADEDEGDDSEADDADADADEDEGDDSEADDADADADEDDEDAEADADESDEEAEDPVAVKRIARIQQEERRAKQAIAAERTQLQEERQALETLRGEVEEFKSLRAKARFDPLSTLLKLGLGDEDLEPAARLLYAASPEGRKDPKLREQAAQMQRVRGHGTDLEQATKKIEELQKRIDEREIREQQQQQIEQYAQRVTGAVNGKTPIVSALLKNQPDMARQRLIATAQALVERTGEVPEPGDVVAELERERRAELTAMGITPPEPARKKKKTGTKQNTEKAAKTEKAPPPKKEQTDKQPPGEIDTWELRDQILQEMPD
jgi:hypothetical protein